MAQLIRLKLGDDLIAAGWKRLEVLLCPVWCLGCDGLNTRTPVQSSCQLALAQGRKAHTSLSMGRVLRECVALLLQTT